MQEPRPLYSEILHQFKGIYRAYIYSSGLQPFSVCRPLSTWWARRRPPVFASLFLTRRFGLICMSHVIRLDAKQNAKGCATCTGLEGATTCGVIQCYPMASGVESQGGPRGSTTHGPPPPLRPIATGGEGGGSAPLEKFEPP